MTLFLDGRKVSSRYSCILYFLLFVTCSLTFNSTASDWIAYRKLSENCNSYNCTYLENGFDVLLFFAHSLDYIIIPIISSVLIGINVWLLEKRKSLQGDEQIFLVISYTFGIIILHFSAIRQALAVEILTIMLLTNSSIIIRVFLFILAFNIHMSALLYTLIGLIAHNLSKNRSMLHIMVYILVIIVLTNIILYLSAMHPIFDRLSQLDNYTNSPRSKFKEFLLDLERLVIFISSYYLLLKYRLNSFVKFILILSLAGSILHFSLSDYFEGFTGRMVAAFRTLDIFILYLFGGKFLGKGITICLVILYGIVKFYFSVQVTGLLL